MTVYLHNHTVAGNMPNRSDLCCSTPELIGDLLWRHPIPAKQDIAYRKILIVRERDGPRLTVLKIHPEARFLWFDQPNLD